MKNYQLLLFTLLAVMGFCFFVEYNKAKERIETPALSQRFIDGVCGNTDYQCDDLNCQKCFPIVTPIVGPPSSDIADVTPIWDETDYSYDQAMKIAKERNQNVFVVFHATWCGPCKSFKTFTINNPKVKNALHPYIRARVDIDVDKVNPKKHNIRGVPTYLILDKNGNTIKKGSGNKKVRDFLKWLNEGNSVKKLYYYYKLRN